MPIPEAHVASLAVGTALHLFVRWGLFQEPWAGHAIGWPLVLVGVWGAVWAVLAVRDMDISRPTGIVSTGPYAFSRNPMYVAWTLIYAGIAFIVNTAWPLMLLPVVLIYTHYRVIRREERYLERQLGGEYRQYRARVRRYL